MKNNLKFLLFSTIVTSIFSINILNANDECKLQCQMRIQNDMSAQMTTNNYNACNTVVESVHINDKDKKPREAKTGGRFAVPEGTTYTLKGSELLVGEKNDDTNFLLHHYAKFKIQKGSTLELYNNSSVVIQKDGKLINRGNLILYNGSSLIAHPIKNSQDFDVNRNRHKKLKHGIDNKHGTIIIKKGSSAYWQEAQTNKITNTTIYKGTVDLRDLLRNISELSNFKSNLYLKLKEVKIILFDSIQNIDISKLNNIEVFKNIYLGKNCQIDGTFDFQKQTSSVVRIKENITKNNVTLSKGTVVRKSDKSSSTQDNIIRNLFGGNIKSLVINSKQYDAEKITYSMKQLLQEFNNSNKITIINTDYTDICNLEYYSNYFNKELTNDWGKTIDSNILPLNKSLFVKNNNVNCYNMYFNFEGSKNISFILQNGTISNNNYQIAFYSSFQNYNVLLNEQLLSDNNVINNFVQKYSGVSPYLQTDENTIYEISPNDSEQNYVILRLKKHNNSDYAVLGKLIIGTNKTPVTIMIDCSYSNGQPNYAQKLLIKELENRNSNSKIIVTAGQAVNLRRTNTNDILDCSSESSSSDDCQQQINIISQCGCQQHTNKFSNHSNQCNNNNITFAYGSNTNNDRNKNMNNININNNTCKINCCSNTNDNKDRNKIYKFRCNQSNNLSFKNAPEDILKFCVPQTKDEQLIEDNKSSSDKSEENKFEDSDT